MVKGIFIVIEGMDGCGKGEMVKLLHNYLFSKNRGYSILTTREPTKGTYGKEIREILSEDKKPQENAQKLLNLFIKDREEHVNSTIKPFIENIKGDRVNIVICDRYYHSTIVFQATQGLETDTLIGKNKKFPKPDITFIMDLKPEIALERIRKREKEKFERLEFMNELREKFLELPKLLDENIIIIDASKKVNEVFECIKKEVEELL